MFLIDFDRNMSQKYTQGLCRDNEYMHREKICIAIWLKFEKY